jgi:hypothetical protein
MARQFDATSNMYRQEYAIRRVEYGSNRLSRPSHGTSKSGCPTFLDLPSTESTLIRTVLGAPTPISLISDRRKPKEAYL